MTEQTDNIVELQNVTKVYVIESQRVEALRGVSLSVKRGSMLALTGKSGSGKSTLLHLIGALDKPTSGRIIANGTDISGYNDFQASQFRNSAVGFVLQNSNLLPEFNAIENVMMPGLISGADRKIIDQRARELLTAVGLAKREKHRPGELSGGEQQRVAIARALFMAPPLLMADEPTGNLDQKTSHAVQDLLFELCGSLNMTMLMVTHDPDLAKRLPIQIIMEDGRIVDGGT